MRVDSFWMTLRDVTLLFFLGLWIVGFGACAVLVLLHIGGFVMLPLFGDLFLLIPVIILMVAVALSMMAVLVLCIAIQKMTKETAVPC